MSKRYPEIVIVDVDEKDTTYQFTLPVDAQSYTIKPRGNHSFKLALSDDFGDNGKFITIPAGSAESEDNLMRESPLTLFFQCEVGSEKMEIKLWR